MREDQGKEIFYRSLENGQVTLPETNYNKRMTVLNMNHRDDHGYEDTYVTPISTNPRYIELRKELGKGAFGAVRLGFDSYYLEPNEMQMIENKHPR